MNPHPHPIIARRDLTFQAISLVLATGATIWCAAWSIPLWIIALFVLQFFRDPARQVPQDEGAVLSPADGRIVAVGRTGDVYARREAIKFSVSMNVFNVHSNRSPVDGAVEKMQYFPGKFMNADRDKASTKNGRNAVILKTVGGQAVTAAQVAGLIARRILRYVKAGDVLQRGRRYGFIRSGSRVDVYLPLTATVREAIADKVSATTTILAILPGN